jgi:hypothetical protein
MPATQRLFGCAVVVAGLLSPRAASAEPQSDSEKIERLQAETTLLKEQLQRQTELMQRQFQALQEELRQTKKERKQAKAERTQSNQPVDGWKTSSRAESHQPDRPQSATAITYTTERAGPSWTQQVRTDPPPEETRSAKDSANGEKAAPGVVQFPNGRPTIASADGQMSLAFGTQFQFDTGISRRRPAASSNRPAHANSTMAKICVAAAFTSSERSATGH